MVQLSFQAASFYLIRFNRRGNLRVRVEVVVRIGFGNFMGYIINWSGLESLESSEDSFCGLNIYDRRNISLLYCNY